jgi:phosphonate transport system substrate-binding protein
VDAGENIRELVRFPNVTKPWIARSGLDEDVLQALRASLLEVKDRGALAPLKIDGFLEGNDDDYKVIRKAMENNQAFFAERDDEASRPEALLSSASDGKAEEPGMQAAVASKTPAVEASDILTVSHLKATPSISQDVDINESRFVTVNITLPRSLFDNNNGQGTNAITINLTIPEAVSDTGRDNVVPPDAAQ